MAELVSVMFLLAMISTAVAFIIAPLMRSQNRTQAKVDTVQTADMALYRVERDLRNTNSGLIFSCTTGSPPSCQQPPTALAATQAIVMPSAYTNGVGQFQLISASGKPKWLGATVYWVDAQGNIKFGFDQPSGYVQGSNLTATQAQTAVTDVQAAGGTVLARSVQQMSLAVPGAGHGHQVLFQLQAQSTINGSPNETTYTTDVATRN